MRFNQVFFILVLAVTATALLLPPAMGDRARGKVDNLFLPVAGIVRTIAATIDAKMTSAPPPPTDKTGRPKTTAELQDEIESLKFLLGNVTKQLEVMQQISGEMRDLGEVSKYCKRYNVFASDSGTRQTLSLRGSSFNGLRNDMPVIDNTGLVGRLHIVGLASARVRLITDQEFPIQCEFRRYEKDTGVVPLRMPSFVVTADKSAVLHVQNFKMGDTKYKVNNSEVKLRVGDTVHLSDRAWPDISQGVLVGEVASITEERKNALFADIVVKPKRDLMKLTSVLVVTGKK